MMTATENSTQTDTSAASAADLDSGGHSSGDTEDKRRGIGSLICDLMSLAELQGRLLKTDLDDIRKGGIIPVAMIMVGIVLLFATAPVFLLTIGWCLVEFAELPLWGAMMLSVGLGGLIPAALLVCFGWSILKRKSAVLQRSTAELKENSRWLKHRIKSSF